LSINFGNILSYCNIVDFPCLWFDVFALDRHGDRGVEIGEQDSNTKRPGLYIRGHLRAMSYLARVLRLNCLAHIFPTERDKWSILRKRRHETLLAWNVWKLCGNGWCRQRVLHQSICQSEKMTDKGCIEFSQPRLTDKAPRRTFQLGQSRDIEFDSRARHFGPPNSPYQPDRPCALSTSLSMSRRHIWLPVTRYSIP
jgi:hypothetical protein